jgi:hypothetical protein
MDLLRMGMTYTDDPDKRLFIAPCITQLQCKFAAVPAESSRLAKLFLFRNRARCPLAPRAYISLKAKRMAVRI